MDQFKLFIIHDSRLLFNYIYCFLNRKDANAVKNIFSHNVYRELNKRDDALEALADAYDKVKILTAEEMKENEEKGIDDSSEFFLGTNVEILIASELFEIPDDALTDSQRRLCDRIMERSRKVQEIRDEQGDLYNMYSNGFYEFYIMLADPECQETMEKSALMPFVPEVE